MLTGTKVLDHNANTVNLSALTHAHGHIYEA